MSDDYNKGLSYQREGSDRLNRDFRVCMACVVTEVNGCKVSVVPAFRERIMDKSGRNVSHEQMQEIEDVPLAIVGGVKFEVEEGDHGLIYFHDVSLDEYLDSEVISDLSSVSRHHDYTDAIFLPFDIRCSAHDASQVSINKDNIKVGNTLIEGEKVTVGDVVINQNEVTIDGIEVKKTLNELASLLGITLPL